MNSNEDDIDIELKTISVADTDIVDQYENEVDEILDVLGHSEALVTDESKLSDFDIFGECEDEIITNIKSNLYIDCKIDDYIKDIAILLWRNRYER
mgnify:CR=1 FL=1